MFNIVLVEPEIPQNTGNIARTCACTDTRLHLIKPLGFKIDEKSVRRAGLDYWDKVSIFTYENLDDFFDRCKGNYYFLSTKAEKSYTDAKFCDGDYFLFGKETKGLPEPLIFGNYAKALRVPMTGELRCLNLASSVAVVLYEALRQNGFTNLH